jgi:hypothetical protein
MPSSLIASLFQEIFYTPPYGHAPTYQISLTYLERQKVMVRTSFAEKKQKWWKKKKSD